jgi:hypothetical protein
MRVCRAQCHDIFHESSSPKPTILPLAPFHFFSSKTRKRIRKSTCIDGVIDTVHIDRDDTGVASGEFAAGVNDAGGNVPLVSTRVRPHFRFGSEI